MRFCPECGYPLNGEELCSECGYNYVTKTRDEKIYNKKMEESKKLNEMSNDNILGPVYIDEIPKELIQQPIINQDGFAVIGAIKNTITNNITSITSMSLENQLYNLYKNNKLSKEIFISELNKILSLKIENSIKKARELIENDK